MDKLCRRAFYFWKVLNFNNCRHIEKENIPKYIPWTLSFGMWKIQKIKVKYLNFHDYKTVLFLFLDKLHGNAFWKYDLNGKKISLPRCYTIQLFPLQVFYERGQCRKLSFGPLTILNTSTNRSSMISLMKNYAILVWLRCGETNILPCKWWSLITQNVQE